jgi:hypothetical protein
MPGKEERDSNLADQVQALDRLNYRQVALLDRVTELAMAMSVERESIGKLLAQFAEEVKALRESDRLRRDVAELARLVQAYQSLPQELAAAVREVITERAGLVGKAVHAVAERAARDGAREAVATLGEASREARVASESLRSAMRWSELKWALLTVLGAVAAALLSVWIAHLSGTFAPTSLTEEQQRFIALGRSLDHLWPQLPDAMQQEFKRLARNPAR